MPPNHSNDPKISEVVFKLKKYYPSMQNKVNTDPPK
jgi:hypothetical protein